MEKSRGQSPGQKFSVMAAKGLVTAPRAGRGRLCYAARRCQDKMIFLPSYIYFIYLTQSYELCITENALTITKSINSIGGPAAFDGAVIALQK